MVLTEADWTTVTAGDSGSALSVVVVSPSQHPGVAVLHCSS